MLWSLGSSNMTTQINLERSHSTGPRRSSDFTRFFQVFQAVEVNDADLYISDRGVKIVTQCGKVETAVKHFQHMPWNMTMYPIYPLQELLETMRLGYCTGWMYQMAPGA